MIQITIVINEKQQIDIGVSIKQTMIETLSLLEEKGIITMSKVVYLKILRLHKCVSILSSYQEAGIMQGDKLLVC